MNEKMKNLLSSIIDIEDKEIDELVDEAHSNALTTDNNDDWRLYFALKEFRAFVDYYKLQVTNKVK